MRDCKDHIYSHSHDKKEWPVHNVAPIFGSYWQVIWVSFSIGAFESMLNKIYTFVRNVIRTVKKQQIVRGERYPLNAPAEEIQWKGPFLKNLSVPNVELKSDETKELMKRMWAVECPSPLKIQLSKSRSLDDNSYPWNVWSRLIQVSENHIVTSSTTEGTLSVKGSRIAIFLS